ncbi:MAG TPA: M56 family metallopeptidase [Clostridia bacterium]|nr:M56 family metallopeptidase [Clostridia bacterium]
MDIAFVVNVLLNSTIMASILFFLILFVKRAFKNRLSAKWHYFIWFIFILRLAVPYVAYSPLNLSDLFKVNTESYSIQTSEPQTPHDISISKDSKTPANLNTKNSETVEKTNFLASLNRLEVDYRLLFLIWLVGVIVLSLYSFMFNVYFWSKVKNGKAFTEQNIIGLLEECKEELGVKTNVSIILTSGVSIPAIFGVTRPWLLMPENVLARLKHEKLRFVILHELAHLKRRDIAANWLAFILQIIYWFNPLVWIAFNRMRLDRELSCDEAVLMHLGPDDSKKYGHTILDMAEMVSQKVSYAGIAGILESKSRLRDRIIMISRFNDRKRAVPVTGIAIALLLATSVMVNAGNYTGTKERKDIAAKSEIVADDGSSQAPVITKIPEFIQEADPAGYTEKMAGTEDDHQQSVRNPSVPETTPVQSGNNSETVTSGTVEEGIGSLIGARVTTGISVTESFSSRRIIIDKGKLPRKFPDRLKVSVVRTEAASDLDILNMISHHKQQKIEAPSIGEKSGDNCFWQDNNYKYCVILFFDVNMNYLGYYVYEKSDSGGKTKTNDTNSEVIPVEATQSVVDAGGGQSGSEIPEAGTLTEQPDSLGIEVENGITISAESDEYFAIYIEKDKLPAELPDQTRMFMTTTDDISDSNVLSMASSYMNLRYENMVLEGKSTEYFHFQKSNNKYIIIFIYDKDFNYLGYYVQKNPHL